MRVNNSTDWRNLDAGPDLDRIIGEKLGYLIYHYDKDVRERCFYMLMAPDGSFPAQEETSEIGEHGIHAGERKTEAEAWEDLPHFSTDANVALNLVDEVEFNLTNYNNDAARLYTGEFGLWEAVVESYYAMGDTPALAICRAWLSWKVQQA